MSTCERGGGIPSYLRIISFEWKSGAERAGLDVFSSTPAGGGEGDKSPLLSGETGIFRGLALERGSLLFFFFFPFFIFLFLFLLFPRL